MHDKPVLVIRSPEKLNHIESLEQKGSRLVWFDIPKNIKQVILKAMKKDKPIVPNIKDDFTTVMSKATIAEQTTNKKDKPILPGNKKLSKNKKAMIITVSIILVMVTGVLGRFYIGTSTKATTPTRKTTVPNQPTGETGSAGETNGVKGGTGSATENADATKSTGSTTETTGSTESPTGTTGD